MSEYEDEKIREEVAQKSEQLRKILEENLIKDPAVINEAMLTARKLKQEIEVLGFLVTWEIRLRPENLSKIEVEVTIWSPKKDMPPEDQKLYDEWYENVLKRKD